MKLLNASNPNIETLRRSMIPTQLCQVKVNTGYAPSFGIFEIGHVVDGVDENNLAKEHKKLCVTLFSKVDNVETLYFRLRDMLCVAVSDILHKDLSFHAMTATHSYEHPKNLNAIVLDGVELGEIGVAHPVVGKNIDKKAAIVFAEIDTEALASLAPRPSSTASRPAPRHGAGFDLRGQSLPADSGRGEGGELPAGAESDRAGHIQRHHRQNHHDSPLLLAPGAHAHPRRSAGGC